MKRLIFPEIMRGRATAFFTGKDPGADAGSIARLLNIRKERIYMPIQRHTDKVLVLGASLEPKIADAVITREKGLLIGVQVADCVPLLICESKKGVIGAVHAGWRGTAAGILKKTLKEIMESFFCEPEDIVIAAGPAIRKCCYCVDYDVMHAVRAATGEGDYYTLQGEKYYLDLPSANRVQAITVGIPESNIWLSGDCTFCDPGKFFSYRRAKGPAGRQGGFIGIL